MSERIRVLIVDDSAFVRRAVERMLSDHPDVRVVGMAANGTDAVRLAEQLHPDVIIMDVNMPELDGLEALQQIMRQSPTGVLMLSTLTHQGARTTLRALDLGAVDFLDKTSAGTVMDIYGLAPVLVEKVLAVSGATLRPRLAAPDAAPAPPPDASAASRPAACPYDMVAIGTSTGGPRALVEVLSRLPADFGAGVVIAQHMPAGFTHTLAERLDRRSPLRVAEARDGDAIAPGRVLIAPGGTQITVVRSGDGLVARVDTGPTSLLHHPSVDLLFRSVAEAAGERAVGVVLTGMGDDGARGLQAMRDAGARTLAESEATAVIYGMPRAASPAAERVLPLPEIGPALALLCSDSSSRAAGER
jgi:two-component system chemotaxis response regulator CheB